MTKQFVFRRSQTIGAAAAEQDGYYLSRCFVDTGDLDVIGDVEDPRRILVGRTGSGKSALLVRLAEVEEHVLGIEPEALSLTYIANSNVLRFFSNAGVKLDIFYRLLWRHVFCVEILKERFRIDTDDRKKAFLERLWRLIPRSKKHEKALAYLRDWGESFWQETEYRIKEITTKLEEGLQDAIAASLPQLGSLSASAAEKLTTEQKEEVTHRGQEVVNKVQIRQLSDIIDLLGDTLLTDPQQRYYLTIDRLDEDWVEDNLRFRLIRAVIQTSLDFTRIKNVKIIVAIRQDLVDRVYRYTRDAGFQEEKYRTSSLDITWSRNQLVDVLDSRIRVLVREQYTTAEVAHGDLLPMTAPSARKKGQKTIDWMIERTLTRPRDIIHFFNVCIKCADGKPVISRRALSEAEGAYSRERLRALGDEWFGLYPNLFHLVRVLRQRKQSFAVSELLLDDLQDSIIELYASGPGKKGLDFELINRVWEGSLDLEGYRKRLVLVFYRVGLVGLKVEPYMPVSWSYQSGASVSTAEVRDDTRVHVQKTFWRVLGITGG